MKKKITVVDKTFTPIVVLADANSAIYEDRGQRPGEQNLLSETVITCTAMDGTKKVATMKASILQVPTKFMPAATTSAPGIPAKQLAINYLCDKSAEVDERYDREKNDNIAMILPVTTHLYIDSLEVEEPYRNRGIATAMLDFIISMAVPESICLFAAKEDAEMQRMSRVQASPMWKNNMSDVQASMLPPYLKDRRLYDGTMFLNDPDACSPAQAAAAATTGLCNQGKLTGAFAAALCRAEMVEKDPKLGAYSYQAAANTTLAEWIDNGIYMDDPRANVGEVICVAFDGKNYFSVAGGMGKVDVSKIGMAPFWFALWGMFRSKLQEFDATFKAYCETQEIDETTRQKLACKMAGTAFDATMGDEINCIAPSTTTCRALKEEQTRSAKYTPDEVWGEFQKLDISGSSSTKVPTFKKTAKFVGAFADKNRVLTDEEKSLVPQLGEDYILPKEVVTTCHLIARTRGTARPMTNVMLRGDPSVGKTAGARAIAAGLGLPYTFITCNAGTEMYNLIGDMMPVDSSASADSINEELFKDLPSATDISMDPAAAYEAITGSEKPDATEVECMTELFRKQMKLCADACNNGFKYVESPLVRAIRNGWVCELQEPSLITRPAVMPGLNGLLDETGCVVLPTGEMLHRHPDCIIISTLNIDLEGCRPLNQAFMDRHHIIMDMQCPTDDVIVKRIKGMTGCGDDVPLKEMVQCIHQIATVCARHGATDGNVNSMRSLANWVQAGMLIGDYVQAAEWTVVSGATSDPETRTELSRTIANHSF